MSHVWEPIKDLPDDWRDLCRDDLSATHRQWVEDREFLKDQKKVDEFTERLRALWAIETGLLERLYTVDRGVTIALVEAGLDSLGISTRGAKSRVTRWS